MFGGHYLDCCDGFTAVCTCPNSSNCIHSICACFLDQLYLSHTKKNENKKERERKLNVIWRASPGQIGVLSQKYLWHPHQGWGLISVLRKGSLFLKQNLTIFHHYLLSPNNLPSLPWTLFITHYGKMLYKSWWMYDDKIVTSSTWIWRRENDFGKSFPTLCILSSGFNTPIHPWNNTEK